MFINPKNWKDINRGYFYQAAMYYLSDTEQPLRFIKKNADDTFNIEKRHGDFSPIKMDGVKRAVEQDIAITVKPRQVIVVSNDIMNKNPNFEYIQVLPVLGVYQSNTKKPWYQRLISDQLPGFAFIHKGQYGVKVDITQISSIHKSMLLEKQSMVPTERMEFIESQMLEVLDL